MKKLYLLILPAVAALALAGVARLNKLPLLPTQQSKLTLLYTGNVEGNVQPVSS